MKTQIPFTQYLRPNGRKRQEFFQVDGQTAVDATRLLDAGLVFEVEVLTTNEVSLTVSNGETDIAIEISKNGIEVLDAVARLMTSAKGVLEAGDAFPS